MLSFYGKKNLTKKHAYFEVILNEITVNDFDIQR